MCGQPGVGKLNVSHRNPLITLKYQTKSSSSCLPCEETRLSVHVRYSRIDHKHLTYRSEPLRLDNHTILWGNVCLTKFCSNNHNASIRQANTGS